MKTQCTGKLNHLSLPTLNPAATTAFFQQHFGCKIVAAGNSILLRHFGFDIVLDHATETPSWPSNFHFGFEMDTAVEVQQLHTAFAKAGVHLEMGVFNNTRGSRFFCRTPDGVLIEVNTREDKVGDWQKLF
ncbi:VOC family protein [Bordetella sp. N]|uniref:VOC family protein n=1 Tax=Bordetella sp. N TaxID=1746199 RepID=UPI000710977B|nr:VOC family protein [Bordetella sp. N]ALM84218.1 extradiol dioxygenase [Bordetella sp. N]